METEKLSPSQKGTFQSLLDDTSPSVRKALLAHFIQLGPAAREFLLETSHDPNRALAPHASWFLKELNFADPVAEFHTFIQSLNYELESGILLLARTVHPELDISACQATIDKIAQRCRELTVEPASPRERCRIINRVLFHEWGFRGNAENYTDPKNSLIDQVISRRKGLPISLSILYLLIADRLDLDLEPVGLPGHFIVGCYLEEVPFFIDPFDRGIFRDPDETFDLLRIQHIEPALHHLAPTPVREVLSRCCLNLVNHYRDDAKSAQMFAGFVEEFAATYEKHTS